MNRNKILVDNLIKKSRFLSSSKVKEELRINKNSSLIRFLMQYLLNCITEIDYTTELIEIRSIHRVLNYIKPANNEEFNLVQTYIIKIISEIKQKMKLFPEENDISIYLKILEENLNVFTIETKMSLMDPSENVFPPIDEAKLKKIICDLIFKYHNYEYLNALLKHYPSAYNIKIANKTIVLKLLKEYLKNNKNKNYLAMVITLFISGKSIEISDNERENLILLCNESLNNSSLDKKDLLFFKEIIESLNQTKTLSDLERIELLAERYGFMSTQLNNQLITPSDYLFDLRSKNIITIDSDGTLLFDDALSFEIREDGNYELGIYITDLTPIKEGSHYDQYALNHFAACYFPPQVNPLLPDDVTLNNFSLSKGEHIVIANTFVFTPKYELIDFSIEKALINVKANLTNSNISDILIDNSSELYHSVKCLLEISEAISDTYSSIDRYHNIKEIARKLGNACSKIPEKFEETPGHRIVSANMIFLNHFTAKYFLENKLPFIYSNNEFDDQTVINGLIEKYPNDKSVKAMLRSIATVYKPSTFSEVNKGHKGLGLDSYSKVTSPARMYISLYLQRLINDLFVLKMPIEEYLKKYENIGASAKKFNLLQSRNREYVYEMFKLKRRIGLDKT